MAKSLSRRVADTRRRQKYGLMLVHVEVADVVLEKLIEAGRISAIEALDGECVARAIENILRTFAKQKM